LFERGKFTAESTERVTLALVCLAPSLLGYSMVNILARAFYALGDTKTPMKISLVCLTLNLVLAVSLVTRFRQAGLGIANTLSASCNVCFLIYALRHKLHGLELQPLRQTLLPLAAAGLLAGALAWASGWVWEQWGGHATLLQKIGAVFVPAAAAGLAYWLIALWARFPAALEMRDLLWQKLRRRA
jgi:putative peptidoglycan lipid II flippase